MFFFLKILNETKARLYLKADGYSGLRYVFKWDGKLRAYTYQPKHQDEVDDLFKTMGRSTSYIFCPVNREMALTEPSESQSSESSEGQNSQTVNVVPDPITDDLVEQCLHRGVIVTDEDTAECGKRLIAAYDKGATDVMNTPRKRKSASPRKRKSKKDGEDKP